MRALFIILILPSVLLSCSKNSDDFEPPDIDLNVYEISFRTSAGKDSWGNPTYYEIAILNNKMDTLSFLNGTMDGDRWDDRDFYGTEALWDDRFMIRCVEGKGTLEVKGDTKNAGKFTLNKGSIKNFYIDKK